MIKDLKLMILVLLPVAEKGEICLFLAVFLLSGIIAAVFGEVSRWNFGVFYSKITKKIVYLYGKEIFYAGECYYRR